MKFKIGKTASDTSLEVSFDSLDEVADAVSALSDLAYSVVMENSKLRARTLWVEKDGTRTISDSIADNGERVALSILDNWPSPKNNAKLVVDTCLSRASVYDQLTGRRGDKGNWFRQEGELYVLTEFGESQVRDLVARLDREDE